MYYVNYIVDLSYKACIVPALTSQREHQVDEEEKPPFSVRLTNEHREILDALRRLEAKIPSPGGMVKLLIERADPRKQKDKRK